MIEDRITNLTRSGGAWQILLVICWACKRTSLFLLSSLFSVLSPYIVIVIFIYIIIVIVIFIVIIIVIVIFRHFLQFVNPSEVFSGNSIKVFTKYKERQKNLKVKFLSEPRFRNVSCLIWGRHSHQDWISARLQPTALQTLGQQLIKGWNCNKDCISVIQIISILAIRLRRHYFWDKLFVWWDPGNEGKFVWKCTHSFWLCLILKNHSRSGSYQREE